MSISGVGGPQGPQDRPRIDNPQIQQQVEQYQNSIFGQCDTDKSGKLEAPNSEGANEVKTFKGLVDAFIAKITGGNKSEQTATPEDVQGATNEQTGVDGSYTFDKDGNVISDVTTNDDGSKTIKSGNETLLISEDGKAISVKNESGRKVSLVKTDDGEYVFTDEDGIIHQFDENMNPK